jgi:thioredoxin 1
MLDITDINIINTLNSYVMSGQTIFVDFYADWCGPCKMLAPQLEKLTNVTVLKVNGDHSDVAVQQVVNELMTTYEISAFPTILVFKQGAFYQKIVGANLAAIKAAAL